MRSVTMNVLTMALFHQGCVIVPVLTTHPRPTHPSMVVEAAVSGVTVVSAFVPHQRSMARRKFRPGPRRGEIQP